jgi:hypothetical protein
MAYSYNVNELPLTGSFAWYQLIALLISAGWLDKSDSDGTTYASTGGQLTSGGTGAHGLGNTDAWIRLQCPSVNGATREICIQRGTTDVLWRVKYSASAGFTGGTPGATQTPSSTDQVFLCGGGTEASPTFSTVLTTNNTYRCHAVAGGSDTGYPFWFACLPTGAFSGTNGLLFLMDTLQAFDTGDVDPTWLYFHYNLSSLGGQSWVGDSALPPSGGAGWMGATSITSNFQYLNGSGYIPVSSGSQCAPSGGTGTQQFGATPFTSKDIAVPFLVGRNNGQTAPNGPKGWTTMCMFSGSFRSNGDTVSITTSSDHIWLSGGLLPWSGATPLD